MHFKLQHPQFRRICLLVVLSVALIGMSFASQAQLVHPGCLHSAADLARMKSKVATDAQPWKGGFEKLAADFYSQSNYVMKGPFATVDRGTSNLNRTAFEQDGMAAYQQALMWSITANTVHRDKALQIIKRWSSANTTFTGKGAQLIVGLIGFKFVNAAEIMRYNNSGLWLPVEIAATESWFTNNFWPWILPGGAPTGVLDGNWGMAALKCQMAISVFCNDTTKYNSAVALCTDGCASILDSIKGDAMFLGEETETGRDNGHWQLALGDMSEYAQIAYNQGRDLFAIGDNRLLAAFEYLCKYNLGGSVNYTPWKTCLTRNNYPNISPRNPTFRPIYELIYNHYKSLGVNAPYTQQVADSQRPEGSVGGAQAGDSTGFGTLLYTINSSRTVFVHPGCFQTQADMTAVRANVATGKQPWAGEWAALTNTGPDKTYMAKVSAAPVNPQTLMMSHANAAYILAVKGVASGDIGYAKAAERVIDTCVNTVTNLTQVPQTTLRVGIGAIQMLAAAEILAHGFDDAAGWPATNVANAQAWFKNVVYPRIDGPDDGQLDGNWGTPAIASIIAMGIFCDDTNLFDAGVYAYKNGFPANNHDTERFGGTHNGCCSVTQYIWTETGQTCESGRDQGHPQVGIAHLVEAALLAQNQGVDLVSWANYRLVAGFEYHAKYNLGKIVPWASPMPNPCNNYPPSYDIAVSTNNRGQFAPVWEMANKLFGAYSHPYTTEVLNSSGFRYYPNTATGGTYRPERTTLDSAGMGTLLYTPAVPSSSVIRQ